MKVFGIGLSRTGTTSLNDTLKASGLNMIHYPKDTELFGGLYDGCTDIPVVYHMSSLAFIFRDSKFVQTLRDKEEWLDRIVPYFERKRSWGQSGTQVELRKKIYGSPFPNRQEASDAWDAHEARVRDQFSAMPDRLIKINIIAGDDPSKLYEFLGLKNPPNKFIHANKLNDK